MAGGGGAQALQGMVRTEDHAEERGEGWEEQEHKPSKAWFALKIMKKSEVRDGRRSRRGGPVAAVERV